MNDDIHASDELPISLSLEQVQQRFESWRQRRKKRTHIPQSLWKAAVALSQEYSICQLSKALRVNYTALKKQVIKSKDTVPSTSKVFSSSPFIELPAPAAPLIESTIEMIKSDGSVMRMHVKGAGCLDLVELGKAFWAIDS
jgi:hypothetical protein